MVPTVVLLKDVNPAISACQFGKLYRHVCLPFSLSFSSDLITIFQITFLSVQLLIHTLIYSANVGPFQCIKLCRDSWTSLGNVLGNVHINEKHTLNCFDLSRCIKKMRVIIHLYYTILINNFICKYSLIRITKMVQTLWKQTKKN